MDAPEIVRKLAAGVRKAGEAYPDHSDDTGYGQYFTEGKYKFDADGGLVLDEATVGQPSCILGWSLDHYRLADLEELSRHDVNASGVELLLRALGVERVLLDGALLAWLTRTQGSNDAGMPWGEAIRDADDYVAQVYGPEKLKEIVALTRDAEEQLNDAMPRVEYAPAQPVETPALKVL